MMREINMIGEGVEEVAATLEKELDVKGKASVLIEMAFPVKSSRNAVIYCRISDKNQDQASIVTQFKNGCQALKKEKHNITKVYCDKGQSAFGKKALKRECFQRMQEDAKNHDFDLVWCRDRERFSREELYDSVDVEEELEKLGIRVFFLDNNLPEPKSDEERIAFEMIRKYQKLAASKPSQKNSINVTRALLENIPAGLWCGAPPFGFKLAYKDPEFRRKPYLIPHEMESIAIEMIFEMYEKKCTIAQIAKALQGKYQPRKGGRWLQPNISRILVNPVYMGVPEWQFKKHGTVKGSCEPLVSLELWNKVQARRASLSRHGNRQSSGTSRTFASLIKCAECGNIFRSYPGRSTLNADGKRIYSNYGYKCQCNDGNTHRKEIRICTNKVKIAEDWLTQKIRQLLNFQFCRGGKGKNAREFDVESDQTKTMVAKNQKAVQALMEKDYNDAKKIKDTQREKLNATLEGIEKGIKQAERAIDKYYSEFELDKIKELPSDRIEKLKERAKELKMEQENTRNELDTIPEPVPFKEFLAWFSEKVAGIMGYKGLELRNFLIGLGFRGIVHQSGLIDLEFSTLGYSQQELARGYGSEREKLGGGGGSQGNIDYNGQRTAESRHGLCIKRHKPRHDQVPSLKIARQPLMTGVRQIKQSLLR